MTMMATIAPAQLPRLGTLPERFTVDVTLLDIAYGLRESGNQCPVAHAVRRALGSLSVDVLTVDVMEHTASVMLRDAPGRWIEYRHNASGLVRDFDRGQRVRPCVLSLRRSS